MSSGKKKGGGDDGANPGETWKLAAAAAAAGIGIAASAWGLFGSISKEAEPKDDRKKMKAPGRNGDLIYRDDFVQSPSDYFSELRNDKRSKK